MTPYEIRFSLLQEARGILEVKYNQDYSKANEIFSITVNKSIETAKDVCFPEPPTPTEILKVAKELQCFVDQVPVKNKL